MTELVDSPGQLLPEGSTQRQRIKRYTRKPLYSSQELQNSFNRILNLFPELKQQNVELYIESTCIPCIGWTANDKEWKIRLLHALYFAFGVSALYFAVVNFFSVIGIFAALFSIITFPEVVHMILILPYELGFIRAKNLRIAVILPKFSGWYLIMPLDYIIAHELGHLEHARTFPHSYCQTRMKLKQKIADRIATEKTGLNPRVMHILRLMET